MNGLIGKVWELVQYLQPFNCRLEYSVAKRDQTFGFLSID